MKGKTMSAWVKFDAADRDWTSIASIGTYEYPKLFELFGSRNGSGYQIYLHWSGGLLAGTTTIPINTWANITIKADGSSLKIFAHHLWIYILSFQFLFQQVGAAFVYQRV
jgi:hypothetical protein